MTVLLAVLELLSCVHLDLRVHTKAGRKKQSVPVEREDKKISK